MKLVVIGLGQCGGRIADEFARLNRQAISQRGIEIVISSFAVNTDIADLSGLRRVKHDSQHRIVIGDRKTGGHGVGKINELGAEVAKEDADKVIEAISSAKRLPEADAFLLVAGAGGGTGSGAIAILTQAIKERFIDKPVYNLVVLPFEHEEQTEERTIYNAATCLKSCYLVADAVILVDNQRFIRRDASLKNNLDKINALIADPFYNLLCAGEEKHYKYIGSKVLDAGDIIQTLVGWTVIGHSEVSPSFFKGFFEQKDFRNKSAETQKGIQAMDEAISRLSVHGNPADARRALYLLAAPGGEMNMDMVKELGNHLKALAPEAVIRSGDYPRDKGSSLHISVILSEFSDVAKIRGYFTKTISLISTIQKRQEGIESGNRALDGTLKDIPSLL